MPSLALKISKVEYHPLPTKVYSKELKKLITDMLQIDPAKRPSIVDVLNSPLLRDKVTMHRYKDMNDSDNSCLSELSMGNRKVSVASRGLFIDAGVEEFSSLENIVSPKSQVGHSRQDFPVRRIDGYGKEGLRNEKKHQKRGDQLRRK